MLPQLIAWGLAWATQRWCPGLQFPLWQEGRLPAQGSRRLGGIGGRLGGAPQWSLAQVRIPDMRSGWGCPQRAAARSGGSKARASKASKIAMSQRTLQEMWKVEVQAGRWETVDI